MFFGLKKLTLALGEYANSAQKSPRQGFQPVAGEPAEIHLLQIVRQAWQAAGSSWAAPPSAETGRVFFVPLVWSKIELH